MVTVKNNHWYPGSEDVRWFSQGVFTVAGSQGAGFSMEGGTPCFIEGDALELEIDPAFRSCPMRGYSPRPPVAHKLDPYKGIIDARLEEFPKLSAKRLFGKVRAAGYPDGYDCVRQYVSTVRPREPIEPVVRFETPAGCQGQVDFGTFTLPWGRRHTLVIVLGYSRLLWLHFYPRQTMAVPEAAAADRSVHGPITTQQARTGRSWQGPRGWLTRCAPTSGGERSSPWRTVTPHFLEARIIAQTSTAGSIDCE